ncbi:hypothetical protein U0070_005909 [Myodes glareolus]|uniref:Hematological and neurological expressed 1-like protein n=1 Tax=Myodes glareolus TaxID=447135 RepID=A0AAW0HIL8_MYOGA
MFQGADGQAGESGSRVQPKDGLAVHMKAAGCGRPGDRSGVGSDGALVHCAVTVSTGGKGSGIFDASTPVQTRQRLNPPGGKTSDIFGSPVTATAPLAHPNKPKDHVLLCEGEDSKSDLKDTTNSPRGEQSEKGSSKEADRAKIPEPTPTVDSHEPRLGPRPRSHNKVLNPPGGKSSISFY